MIYEPRPLTEREETFHRLFNDAAETRRFFLEEVSIEEDTNVIERAEFEQEEAFLQLAYFLVENPGHIRWED